MFKFLPLLLFPFIVIAQQPSNIEEEPTIEDIGIHEYVPLKDNKVYDIEIIVFAYKHPLPNLQTYTNKPIVDDSKAVTLELKPDDLLFVEGTLTTDEILVDEISEPIITDSEKSNFTVAINDEEDSKQVLAWFKHNELDYKLTAIWEKLIKQPNIIPLAHRAWRQSETPFDDPTYVKLNNVFVNEDSLESNDANEAIETNKTNEFSDSAINSSFQNFNDGNNQYIRNTAIIHSYREEPAQVDLDSLAIENHINEIQTDSIVYADFTLTGMVALSKGRFMHFGNNLNLFRTVQDEGNNEIKNTIFSLNERRQLKTDELNYFDSPWMGSIVIVTEYTGEQESEEANN